MLKANNKVCTFIILLIIISCLLTCPSSAQVAVRKFEPLRDDSLLIDKMIQNNLQRLEKDKALIKGENKKFILEEYEERVEHINGLYLKKQFITDSRVRHYLEDLTQKIIRANPFLDSLQPRVLFSRMYWPNAASFGEGTIMFNISLFNRLQNESQAAFVLCHELAHLYLGHSNNAIHSYINTVYSREFQEQLKDIKKSEYQRGKNLDKLIKNIAYKNRRHGRDHETEADSLALEWMKSTPFDVREVLTCLELLDRADKEKYEGLLDLERQFNFEDYPFRQRWIKAPGRTLGEAMGAFADNNSAEADSLKTHPDCVDRIKRLKDRTGLYYTTSQSQFVINRPLFDSLSTLFDYELIEYCYREDEIGRSMYYALQLFCRDSTDQYLATMIGKCLNRMYEAQKNHTLSKIIDLPAMGQGKEYQQYLRFLQSLKLDELTSLTHYFLQKFYPSFMHHRPYWDEYAKNKKVFDELTSSLQ